jgi:hypothetical protein
MKKYLLLPILMFSLQVFSQDSLDKSEASFGISPSVSLSWMQHKDFEEVEPKLNYNLRISFRRPQIYIASLGLDLLVGKMSGVSKFTSNNITYRFISNITYCQINTYTIYENQYIVPKFGFGLMSIIGEENYTYQIVKNDKIIYEDSNSIDRDMKMPWLGILFGLEKDLSEQIYLDLNVFMPIDLSDNFLNLSFGVKYVFY